MPSTVFFMGKIQIQALAHQGEAARRNAYHSEGFLCGGNAEISVMRRGVARLREAKRRAPRHRLLLEGETEKSRRKAAQGKARRSTVFLWREAGDTFSACGAAVPGSARRRHAKHSPFFDWKG